MTESEKRDWPFSIIVPEDDDCPVCGEMVHNHDDYTLVVAYPDGDENLRKGLVYHTKCVSLIHTNSRDKP